MDRQLSLVSIIMLMTVVPSGVSSGQADYQVKASHPRLFIEDVKALAKRCDGPLSGDYQIVKQRADAAVQRGNIQYITNAW